MSGDLKHNPDAGTGPLPAPNFWERGWGGIVPGAGIFLADVSPFLIAALTELFDRYGPAGVVNTAVQMRDELARWELKP